MVRKKTKRIVIVVSKGTLDMAYPPLILATTAASMDIETHMYFTFWGMDILNKRKVDNLKVSPVGNPGLPIPNILGMIPGMTSLATSMLKGRMKKSKMPSIKEMISTAKKAGVKFHACSPTMEVMGIKKEDFIDEVDDIIGASTYLDYALNADVTLFV